MSDFRPELRDGVCINGCTEITEAGRQKLAAAKAEAVPLDLLWNAHGEMPVIAWDDDLINWINDRAEFLDRLRAGGKPTAFWSGFASLPRQDIVSDVLCWNQGSIPSCCLTATSHAIQAATLIASLLGAPVKYDAVNPIYAHFVSLGGRMNSGQDCFAAASFINEKGTYPVSKVGDNNLYTPSDYRQYTETALEHRVAVSFIPDPDPERVILLARAGLPFVFGSSEFYTSNEMDRNGIAVGTRLTSGAHAEMGAGAYVEKNGTEYAYVQNSHGDSYGTDETGKTASGYWLTASGWERLCSTMTRYGDPFIVIPRADTSDRLTFVPNGFNMKERRA